MDTGTMRTLCLAFALILAGSLTAFAQETPRVEVFTGYSYLHASFADAITPGSADFHGNLNGWDASVAFNANPWLGVVADFGGYYGSPFFQVIFKPSGCVLCTQGVNTTIKSIHTFMGGPKLSHRRGKATVFAQALFGGSHMAKEEDSFFNPQFITPATSSTNFSMSLG